MFKFPYFISANLLCIYLIHKDNNIAYRWRKCFKIAITVWGWNVYICRSKSWSYYIPSLMVCRPGDHATSPLHEALRIEEKGLLHTVCCSINDLALLSSKKTLNLMQIHFNSVKKRTTSLHSSTTLMYKQHNAVYVKFECQCKMKHIAQKCLLYYTIRKLKQTQNLSRKHKSTNWSSVSRYRSIFSK